MNGVYNGWCSLKKENPETTVGMSIGGWYDANYFSVATSDEHRIAFAKSSARYFIYILKQKK